MKIFQVRILERAAYSNGKEYACNAGDAGVMDLIPGLVRSPGGGNGNPFQYSCLENPMDLGAWWARIHGVRKRYDQNNWDTCSCIYIITLFSCCVYAGVEI